MATVRRSDASATSSRAWRWSAAYEGAENEAERLGLAHFETETCLQLEDLIASTFLAGIVREADTWATRTVKGGPEAFHAPVPFADEAAWLHWVLANVSWPISICGPDGEDVADDEAVASLLRQALRAVRPEGIRYGWLPTGDRVADTSAGMNALRRFLQA